MTPQRDGEGRRSLITGDRTPTQTHRHRRACMTDILLKQSRLQIMYTTNTFVYETRRIKALNPSLLCRNFTSLSVRLSAAAAGEYYLKPIIKSSAAFNARACVRAAAVVQSHPIARKYRVFGYIISEYAGSQIPQDARSNGHTCAHPRKKGDCKFDFIVERPALRQRHLCSGCVCGVIRPKRPPNGVGPATLPSFPGYDDSTED